ncbi:MAG: hypothetical protein KDA25_05880 [Phycisphaerales bacterium]|nr:hypothetical protein [Phycisphaerales bacterium]
MTNDPTVAAKPLAEVKLRSVRGTIWGGRSKYGRLMPKATFSRRFQDADGNWTDSHSYDIRELCILSRVITDVITQMQELSAADGGTAVEDED